MLLPIPLLLVLAATANEISGAAYRVELPVPLAAHYEHEAPTPWGLAHVDEYLARDARGITYIFSTYRYRSAAVLKVSALLAVRENFLQQHKCVATTLDKTPIRTADASVWPQTAFGGSCAAPGDYRILVLIADGRHYQLQVSNDPQPLSRQSAEQAVIGPRPRVGTQDLDQALIEFAGHCRFDLKAVP